MKHKTAELEGAMLDAAVAKAEGIEHDVSGLPRAVFVHSGSESWLYRPSQEWSGGGPIIERERIAIWRQERDGVDGWAAAHPLVPFGAEYGSDCIDAYAEDKAGMWAQHPLIAAMRAYVASKFGEEVEPP